MKSALLAAALVLAATATSAFAGPRVFINVGGGYHCGPRYYAPPVCYVPRRVYSCAPVVSYRSSYSYDAPHRVYRAPVYRSRVSTGPVAFGWRR